MADEMKYDYGSMAEAYRKLKNATDNINSESQEMTSDAMRLLSTIEGNYATEYNQKLIEKPKGLNPQLAELNDVMTKRAGGLQQSFDDMADLDRTVSGR